MKVLDLGGRASHWMGSPRRPAQVLCVNLEPPEPEAADLPWLRVEHGDACAWRCDERFDLVFSNSLIEHVGGHERRLRLADRIRAAGDAMWVQTPYRYFPVEPHFLFPGFQQLPIAARARIAQQWPRRDAPRSHRDAYRHAAWIDLLTISDMRDYFPGTRLWFERFGGVVKSVVAIQR